MEFRVLGPHDLATMYAMLSLFGRAFDAPESYESAQPDAAYLSGLLASSTFIAVAALHHGRVVGGLAANVLPKFEQARNEVYIYDVAVDEPFRRQRVATGLIDTLRGVAAEREAWFIYVQANPGGRPRRRPRLKAGCSGRRPPFRHPYHSIRTRQPLNQ